MSVRGFMTMFKFTVPAALIAAFALSATAQATDDEVDAARSSNDSSSSERAKVSLNIGVELYLGANLSAGYQVNQDTALEAFVETGPLALFTPCGSGEKRIDGGFIAGARFRRFLGNSLNFAVAPYYRDIKIQCRYTNNGMVPRRVDGTSPAIGATRTIDDKNSLGVSASIGNRWHWQHFYLGAEWLGIGVDRSFRLVKESGVTVEENVMVMFLRLVLGASF